MKNNLSAHILSPRDMPCDFYSYGDKAVSRVFWKPETARNYWGRYFNVLEMAPPPEKHSFQDYLPQTLP